MVVPEAIKTCFREKFGFPDAPLIGQVATVTPDGPTIRSMRMYQFNEAGQLIFMSHRHSHKWRQLVQDPKLAICFVSSDLLTQVTVKGDVTLKQGTPDLQSYWENVRLDVRKIYDNYDVEGPFTGVKDLTPPKLCPDSFGLILVNPTKWELLELSPSDYPASNRTVFHLEHGKWSDQRVNVG